MPLMRMLIIGYATRNERKKVEMLFAHLKTTMRFERMRLRRLSGARDEFLLAAIAQNPRRMVRLARCYRHGRARRGDGDHYGSGPFPHLYLGE
jgi:hypothetical protein